jgi:predicted enzyme related to lactoylglutathione lyase
MRSVDTATTNDGIILMTPQPRPGVGWLAMCKDTEGSIFGILQMEHA